MSVYYGGLAIGGWIEGYSLSFPVLPLAYYPRILFCVSFLSKGLVLFLILLFQAAVVLFFKKKKSFYFFLAGLSLLPFLVFSFFWRELNLPLWTKHVEIARALSKTLCIDDYEKKIEEELIRIKKEKKDLDAIFMPESTFPFPINNYPFVVDLWSYNALTKNTKLVLGTHRKEGSSYLNCVCVLHQGRITKIYDKKEHLLLTEKFPRMPLLKILFKDTFLKSSYPFISGSKKKNIFFLKEQPVEFFLCSEFFVPRYFSDVQSDCKTIVCFVNDGWFSCNYIVTAMLLCARMHALENNKNVLYVSHKHGCFIGKDGLVGHDFFQT
ncbi:hypothetical protein HN446_03875 [bacterium]|nr:hypothetical protein [bacterium]